jgi:hypothetical protein
MYAVSLLVTGGDDVARATNELPLALAPELGSSPPIAVSRDGDDTIVALSVSPKVWRSQQVRLIVGEAEIGADPLSSAKAAVLTFRAPSTTLPHGPQHVRLRVDGVESLLIDTNPANAGSDPPYRASQSVVLP